MAKLTKILRTVDSVEACECMCDECGALTTFTAFDFENCSFCPQCGAPLTEKVIDEED